MLKINLRNLANINPAHGLNEDEINLNNSKLSEFIDKIHNRQQGFYKIIDDDSVVQKVKDYTASVQGQFESIVLCGIGGSSLGPICLQQSLTHLFQNQLKNEKYPKLYVLDNIDPVFIAELEDIINYEKTLFIIVTKSGGTPETLAEYFYFRKQCENKKLNIKQHFVFITDSEKGLLRKVANKEDIITFDVPEDVGGRFSVLTAVGLLPAALIGIDIDQLLVGAKEMRDKFLSSDSVDNLSFKLATIQYLLGEKGKIMNVMFPYAQKLIRFSDWYRQLLAESIGKKINNKGETVHVGLTPIHALGVTDQHSQSQLYNEGPNDKLFMFIEVNDFGVDREIPNLYPEDESLAYLNNVSFKKLIQTEKKGTEQAFNQNDRPNITISIEKIDAYHLGQLFLLFEGATAFLGEYYEINAFDQPGVELSKNLTKEMLK